MAVGKEAPKRRLEDRHRSIVVASSQAFLKTISELFPGRQVCLTAFETRKQWAKRDTNKTNKRHLTCK
jgi:hypothetical protein